VSSVSEEQRTADSVPKVDKKGRGVNEKRLSIHDMFMIEITLYDQASSQLPIIWLFRNVSGHGRLALV